MEFNPESTTQKSIENAIELGVKRFSLGLQTFDSSLLTRIGRSHSVKAGLEALQMLLKYPGISVSGDLMFNLPGQSVSSFLKDVNRLSDYPLNHISFYGLTVNPRSLLGQKVEKGKLRIDEKTYEPMYVGGVEILDRKGFKRYEVSNFAKPGFESIHNQNYWNRGEYIGFGPSAHSFLGTTRFYAPEIYPRWREYVRMECPSNLITRDMLSRDDVLMEFFWLSLRQASGLDLNQLKKMGKILPEECYSKWLEKGYLELNVLGENNRRLALRDRGWIFMDDIVTDLVNKCSNLE